MDYATKTIVWITYFVVCLMFGMMLSQAAKADTCTKSIESTQVVTTTNVPPALVGAVVRVTMINGQTYDFDSNEYMVVRRKQERTVKSKLLICRPEVKRNRVSLLAGQGAQAGLSTKKSGPNAEVESNVGLVVGGQYQRLVTDKVSVGVQIQSSETALGVIGLEF